MRWPSLLWMHRGLSKSLFPMSENLFLEDFDDVLDGVFADGDELQAEELRWLWIVIYAVMLGICVARSVQLTRDLIRLMKEEEK